MRIGFFHNRYLQRGGEDTAAETEALLLAKAGHVVERCVVANEDALARPLGAARIALRARWNPDSERRVERMLRDAPLDVAHVHNFFPLFSPALHAALSTRGVPVVQTLHNYRLMCANGYLLREERICEDCVPRGPWNAVRHGCYRGSRVQTAVWADMVGHHRARGTWHDHVDRFAVPTAFAGRKLAAAQIPADRIEVLPYLLPDPGEPAPPGRGAVFVGRLSREKGVDLLIDAWRTRGGDAPLTIVGTGPEENVLRAWAGDLPNVHFLGAVAHEVALDAIRRAAFAVVPSRWFEISPFAAIEAMACARAVVAWRGGALAELVPEGEAGLHFDALDAASVAAACGRLLDDRALAVRLGAGAREHYLEQHAPEAGLARRERLYAAVSDERRRAGSPAARRSPG